MIANRENLSISIPTGAIKSPYTTRNLNFESGFQFLLVRLKERNKGQFKKVERISIPTGAIKSGVLKSRCESIKVISIPTGAIKS